jgi:hypothetical protein
MGADRILGGIGLSGGKKPNVAEEQAKLKAAADAAARNERDKAAAAQANKENLYAADAAQTSARSNFMAGITQDTEENRRKFLKKA